MSKILHDVTHHRAGKNAAKKGKMPKLGKSKVGSNSSGTWGGK